MNKRNLPLDIHSEPQYTAGRTPSDATKPLYEVVWPLGQLAYDEVATPDRFSDLNNKTVCELWDWLFKGEEIFPMLRDLLSKRYPGIKFVEYNAFGNTHGGKQTEVFANLPRLLREHGCEIVISGIGN